MKFSELQGKRNEKSGVRVKNAKKRERKPRLTYHQIFLVGLLLLVFMGSGIGYVWSNFEGTQIGYDLSRLQKEERELIELNKKLRVELATLKSPQYLERHIRAGGLKEASPDQIVILP
jgi:hypothetical protein